MTKKAHPKHAAKHKKTAAHPKHAAAHAVKKVVHVVPAVSHHPAATVAAITAGHASGKAHLVDLALESVHVNLRRSNGKYHHA